MKLLRWALGALTVVVVTAGCVPSTPAVKDPPPLNWEAVYYHYLVIDADRNPVQGNIVDIVADVVTVAPAKFYDADTGRLRDYPVSVSKPLPYILPFWYDPQAHGSISTTAYYGSAAGDTLICYVSDKNGVELPGTRSEKTNYNGESAQLVNPCYYNF